MLGTLPVLGAHAFDQAAKALAPLPPMLHCKGKDEPRQVLIAIGVLVPLDAALAH